MSKYLTAEKIRAKVRVDSNGCWIWSGTVNPVTGYGSMSIQKKNRYAHRLAYELYKGPIPSDLELDHLCRVRACCNPDHLEAVTHRENCLRSPVNPMAINAAKTHCKHGHEFTDENTYVPPSRPRVRICRACTGVGLGCGHNRDKTQCKNGHSLSGENVRFRPNGGRQCRACATNHMRAFYARRRAVSA